ncbi:SEC-C metal-binding domain-containing protein [Elusimicrobiota bacterium]
MIKLTMGRILRWMSKFFSKRTEKGMTRHHAEFKKLSDNELVRLAFTGTDQLPMAWAQEVISRGERLVPALCDIITHGCNWHKRGKGWCAVNHATYLLGMIGGEPAIAPMVYAMHQADYWDNDWVCEDFPSIFGNLGPKALPFLKGVALKRDDDWYVRERALSSMAAIALRHGKYEREVFPVIAGIVEDPAEDPTLRALSANILMDFGKKQYEPLIMSLVDSGIAKEHYSKDEARRALERKDLRWYQRDWMNFYAPKNIAERQKRWEEEGLSDTEMEDEETCECEEEATQDSGESRDVPPKFPRNARISMEKMLFHTHRAVKQKNPKTKEETDSFLKSLTDKPVQPPAPQNAWEVAQDLMYEAWEEENPKKRVEMARKALRICPECSDAYTLLAQETAETAEQAKEFAEKAVAAGERQMGPEFFKENAGHFWGTIETRPYMRARNDLAYCLWNLGDFEGAIHHWNEMLGLNTHDNQGIRYILAASLGKLGRFDELDKLLEREDFKDDCGLDWLVMKALAAFVREGASLNANRILQKAIEANKFLPEYLRGSKTLPEQLPEHVRVGFEEEAMACAANVLPAWQRVPKSSEWLDEVLNIPKIPKTGRNDPCPCGSGRKFKKCCMKKQEPASVQPAASEDGAKD